MTTPRLRGSSPTGPGSGPGRRAGGMRIAGFAVRLTAGAYVLATLAVVVGTLSLRAAAPGWPAGAYAAATAGVVVVILGSLIGHELAHALAARHYGAGSREILIGFFGGTTHGRYQLPTPRAQWHTAVAGPAASLAAAGLSLAIAAGLSAWGTGQLAVIVFVVAAWINAVLGLVNLLPGAGLDGGLIVRGLVWARTGDPVRAGLTSARMGQVTGAILAAAGLTVLVLGHLGGLWVVLISLLMIAASRAEARRILSTTALSGLHVRDVLPLSPAPPAAIHSWQTVGALLGAAGPSAARAGPAGAAPTAFPLGDVDGKLTGIVTLSQLAAVPAGHRDTTRVSDVGTPIAHIVITTPDEPLGDVLARMGRQPASPQGLHTIGHAVVLRDDGSLAGLLSPADIARAALLRAARPARGVTVKQPAQGR
jgi:CBS domain-containing protein/Zn-dependent protease